MKQLLIVQLDDARYGAGPGTVVGFAEDSRDYIRQIQDRDGAIPPRMRLWQGTASVGDRVRAFQYENQSTEETR